MTARTLGVLVCAICGLIVLVGVISPKQALSEGIESYGYTAVVAPASDHLSRP